MAYSIVISGEILAYQSYISAPAQPTGYGDAASPCGFAHQQLDPFPGLLQDLVGEIQTGKPSPRGSCVSIQKSWVTPFLHSQPGLRAAAVDDLGGCKFFGEPQVTIHVGRSSACTAADSSLIVHRDARTCR